VQRGFPENRRGNRLVASKLNPPHTSKIPREKARAGRTLGIPPETGYPLHAPPMMSRSVLARGWSTQAAPPAAGANPGADEGDWRISYDADCCRSSPLRNGSRRPGNGRGHPRAAEAPNTA
jgi:hypothetical protein